MSSPRRLLILACTKSKIHGTNLLPAIERYDGPAFRVVRRFLSLASEKPIILVLSAEHGLIRHDKLIPFYDRRMTPQLARSLRPQVRKTLQIFVRKARNGSDPRGYTDLFACMSKDYLYALADNIPPNVNLIWASGSPGNKLAALHHWLYPDHSPTPRLSAHAREHQIIKFKGRQIRLALNEALDEIRGALIQVPYKHSGQLFWYVIVDGRPVSPKWFVSRITGVPVSQFHTDEARRVLERLGIKVYRGPVKCSVTPLSEGSL
jgi:hypothetical protein